MSNITFSCIGPAANYVENYFNSNGTDFLKKQLLVRGAYLCLVPASLITTAVDTIIGLGASIGAILTLGKNEPINKFAFDHISMSNRLFTVPYMFFVKAINPEACISSNESFFAENIVKPFFQAAEECQRSDNFLTKHVVSRLTYVLGGLACLVTKAVAGIISIPIAALSVLTVGKFQSMNDLACRALTAPGIIYDLFKTTMLFINPGLDH